MTLLANTRNSLMSLAARIDRDAMLGRTVLVLCALAMTVVYFAALFPYVPTADGMARWGFAHWRVAGGSGIYPEPYRVAKGVGALQTAVLWLFGSELPFPLAQGLLCFLAVYGCVWLAAEERIGRSARLLAWLVLCNVPVLGTFFMVLTDSAWTFIGLVALCVILSSGWPKATARMQSALPWIDVVLIALATFCLFASRPNALTLLAALLIAPWLIGWRLPEGKLIRRAVVGLVLGLVAAQTLPGLIVKVRPINPLALGMAWEMLEVAQTTRDPRLAQGLAFAGDPERGIMRLNYNVRALNALVWDANPPLNGQTLYDPANATRLRDAYIALICSHPVDFARVKLGFWSRTLGIEMPLLGVLRDTRFNKTFLQHKVGRAYKLFGDDLPSGATRPWALMLGGMVYLGMQRAASKRRRGALLVFLAVCYYLSFLITAQAMEYRYFAPTYVALLSVFAVELTIVVQRRLQHRAHRSLERPTM